MFSTNVRRGSSGAVFSSSREAYPTIAERMLLKSWATPPASVPTASIFWAWKSWDFELSLFGDVPDRVHDLDDVARCVEDRIGRRPCRAYRRCSMIADSGFLPASDPGTGHPVGMLPACMISQQCRPRSCSSGVPHSRAVAALHLQDPALRIEDHDAVVNGIEGGGPLDGRALGEASLPDGVLLGPPHQHTERADAADAEDPDQEVPEERVAPLARHVVQVGPHGDTDAQPAPDVTQIVPLRGVTGQTPLFDEIRFEQAHVGLTADRRQFAGLVFPFLEGAQRPGFPFVGRVGRVDELQGGDLVDDRPRRVRGQNGVHLPRHHRGVDERQPGAVAREEIPPRTQGKIGIGLHGVRDRDVDAAVPRVPSAVGQIELVDGPRLRQRHPRRVLADIVEIVDQREQDDERRKRR